MACDESSFTPPPAKKPRTPAKSWKLFLLENFGPEGKIFGLQDLFAHDFESACTRKPTPNGADACTRKNGNGASSGSSETRPSQVNPFYTLRLEHREGGPLARFRGEERILLFRSDRPGAIAKIIYSSFLPDESSDSSKASNAPLPQGDVPDNVMIDANLTPASLTAQAKIHVLDVKAPYRGRDLGGLLFSEAMTSLKSKYCNYDDGEGGEDFGKNTGESMTQIGCKLK